MLKEKVSKNYTKIPNGFFKLKPTDFYVASYLLMIAGQNFPFSSYDDMSENLSITEKTITTALKKLKKVGFIQVKKIQSNTVYELDISVFEYSLKNVSDSCKNTRQINSEKKKKTQKTKEKGDVSDLQEKENSFKLLNTDKNKKHYRPTESAKTTAESYAEANRTNETAAEKKIRQLLEGYSIKHITQKPIYTSDSFYIVDFYLPEINLVVEVDGDYHYTSEQIEKDKAKNEKLLNLGYNVLRFNNKDYRKGWNKIREMINNK